MLALQSTVSGTFWEENWANATVIGVFLFGALTAAGLATFISRKGFKVVRVGYISMFFYAILGGLLGLGLLIFMAQLNTLRMDMKASSVAGMLGMSFLLLFMNMLMLPLLIIWISSKNRKIKALEEELRKKS
jgi:tetrahydromethanopterin S-methyltransferase subunit E